MSFRPIGSRPLPLARLFLGALAGLALLAGPAAGSAQAANPTITSFTAVVGPGGAVTFSGTVTDDRLLGGCLVFLRGGGVNTAAVIMDDGTFNTTVQVFASGPVTVTGQAIDADSNLSNLAYVTFTPTPVGGGGLGGPTGGTVTPPPPPPGGGGGPPPPPR